MEKESKKERIEANMVVLDKVSKAVSKMIENEEQKTNNVNKYLRGPISTKKNTRERMYSREKDLYILHSILLTIEETIEFAEDVVNVNLNIDLVGNLSEHLSLVKENYIDINTNIMREIVLNSTVGDEKANELLRYNSNKRTIEIYSEVVNILGEIEAESQVF